MSRLLFAVLFSVGTFSAIGVAGAREVVIETKKIDNATHWVPEKIEVKPGETIHLVVKHDMEGGFDFHGFHVPMLKVTQKVDRHKAFTTDVTIPKTVKPGEYKIECHFHNTHKPAVFVVKAADAPAVK